MSGGFHGLNGRTQGVLLMSLAMLIIPAVDGLAKFLSAYYSPLMIGWCSFLFWRWRRRRREWRRLLLVLLVHFVRSCQDTDDSHECHV